MPREYSVFISSDAYAALQGAGPHKASKLMWWIGTLGASPFGKSDYTEKEPGGRDLEIKVVDRFAIYYWLDPAACDVKIMRIRSADEPKP